VRIERCVEANIPTLLRFRLHSTKDTFGPTGTIKNSAAARRRRSSLGAIEMTRGGGGGAPAHTSASEGAIRLKRSTVFFLCVCIYIYIYACMVGIVHLSSFLCFGTIRHH
jgi:hypothetical protein